MDEKELVSLCQQGDVEAFEQLISGYERKVINAAYGMLGNREDAYDIAQEVFIKVFNNIGKFNGQSSFSTWLYKVTSNVCLDELRKRKRRISDAISLTPDQDSDFAEVQVADAGAGPQELAERTETQAMVRDAIASLPDDYKAVIVLRELQGLDYQQIAETLSCSLGTVKSRISRARVMLREKLSRGGELF